jgi:hypothetical protein
MRNDGTNKPFKFRQCIAAAAIDSAKETEIIPECGGSWVKARDSACCWSHLRNAIQLVPGLRLGVKTARKTGTEWFVGVE